MNKLAIIGNLTKDPELRKTQSGTSVCSFDVAVNRRNRQEPGEVDYFKVTAWNGLAETCAKYLAKGRKIYAAGPVRLDKREHNGKTYADMVITAEDIEFLSTQNRAESAAAGAEAGATDELPF